MRRKRDGEEKGVECAMEEMLRRWRDSEREGRKIRLAILRFLASINFTIKVLILSPKVSQSPQSQKITELGLLYFLNPKAANPQDHPQLFSHHLSSYL